jgi:hypothetical protein
LGLHQLSLSGQEELRKSLCEDFEPRVVKLERGSHLRGRGEKLRLRRPGGFAHYARKSAPNDIFSAVS